MGSHGLRNPLPGPVAGTSGRASHQHGGRWGCNGLHRSRTISGPDGGYEYDKRLWTLVERTRSRPLGAPPSKSLLPTPAGTLQCDDGIACRRRGGMACSALPGLRITTHGTNASCDIDVWTHASHRAGGRGARLARLREGRCRILAGAIETRQTNERFSISFASRRSCSSASTRLTSRRRTLGERWRPHSPTPRPSPPRRSSTTTRRLPLEDRSNSFSAASGMRT